MKSKSLNIISHLVFLLAGNYLIVEFAFTQTSQRYFAVLGLFLMITSIFVLSAKVPGLSTGLFPTLGELKNSGTSKDKLLKKHTKYSALLLISLVIVQVGFLYQYFESQQALLFENGKRTIGIVYHKEWKRKNKSNTHSYYISYYFEINNKLYDHSKKNDTYVTGDTIEILYLPENPDNHKILEKVE